MLFDFSSIFKLMSKDDSSLNVSVYLGTIYFNIFQNKRLQLKINISEALYYLISETLENFIEEAEDKSKHELFIITKYYNIETKKFQDQYKIGFIKNQEEDKYKPYRFFIADIKSNKSYSFIISSRVTYNIIKNDERPKFADPNFSIRFFRYLWIKKLRKILALSLDNELSQKRKQKYYKQ